MGNQVAYFELVDEFLSKYRWPKNKKETNVNYYGVMFDEYLSKADKSQTMADSTGKRVSAQSRDISHMMSDLSLTNMLSLEQMCKYYGPVDTDLVMKMYDNIENEDRVAVVMCGIAGVGKSSAATILEMYLKRTRPVLRISHDDEILDERGERRHGVNKKPEHVVPANFWKNHPTGVVIFDATAPASPSMLRGCDFSMVVSIGVESIAHLYKVFRYRRALDFGEFCELVTKYVKTNQKMIQFLPNVYLKVNAKGLESYEGGKGIHSYQNPALMKTLDIVHGRESPFTDRAVVHEINVSRLQLVTHGAHVTLNLASPGSQPTKVELKRFIEFGDVVVSYTGVSVYIFASDSHEQYQVCDMVTIPNGLPCYNDVTRPVLHVTRQGGEDYGFMLWCLWSMYDPSKESSFLQFIDGNDFLVHKMVNRSTRKYNIRVQVQYGGKQKVKTFKTELLGHFVYANVIKKELPVSSSDLDTTVIWCGKKLI